MFIHNFKYALKTLFRNKILIFWTFAFPIILGTLFNLAFSNIENSEKFKTIDIAIVDNEEFKNNRIFAEVFKVLSDENNEDRIFNTKYMSKEEAENSLRDNKITGYLVFENEKPKVVVMSSGINETIFKYVTEEIVQSSLIVNDLVLEKIQNNTVDNNYGKNQDINMDTTVDYEKIYKDVFMIVQNQKVNIKDVSSNKLSYTMIEFYTLIAMTCLYGGILGMTAINQNLPNMSNNGKRVAIAPISKIKVVLSSLLAGYMAQLVGLALLFVYTIFILKVDYGTNLPLIILLGLVGSLAGLSLGLAIGILLKTNENTKTRNSYISYNVLVFFIWNDGNYNEVYC